MIGRAFPLLRPLLLALPPELAHTLTLRALELGLGPRQRAGDDPRLAVRALGADLPNPFGVAAGFDKDARVPDALLAMGCGFAEVGTLTPRPQAGNPRPRIFRLPAERALINRLGFNNGGHAAALARLRRRPRRGLVGVNIGANKDSPDRIADYVAGLEAFNGLAGYFTVNVSSPNTPGLRDLQAPAALAELLAALVACRRRLVAAGGPARPIVVKLAPDIADADLPAVLAVIEASGIEGIAVANTTLSRAGLGDSTAAREAGGLSGGPLFQRATRLLARVYGLTGGRLPLIGIGGVLSGEAALAKIEAGASLVQVYTGLVYEGPALIARMKAACLTAVAEAGVGSLAELRGRRAREWAGRP